MRKTTYVRLRKIGIRLLVVTGLSSVLYIYFYTGLFTIHTYKIIGVPENYIAELERDARLVAENKLYYILPGNRTVSYQDDELRTLVMETLPNSKTITIYPWGLHTLVIKVQPHVPVFSVSDTHAIAEDGTVYKEIVPLDSFARLEVASSSSLHPRVLRSVADLITKVNAVLFEVRYVAVDEYNDIRLYDKSKKSAVVVANTASMQLVWSNILSAVDTEPLKGKLRNPAEQLEYIDTRFGNKVFYKFTNVSIPAIIPAHEDSTAATTTPE